MIEGDEDVEGDLLLCSLDFPENFKDMKHPNDGKISDKPIDCDFIRHKKSHHHRLMMRCSVEREDGKYVELTFVLDTGAPQSIYLSPWASELLGPRILNDKELDTDYLIFLKGKSAVHLTPATHQPANIIGLTLLEKLGLHVTKDGFGFDTPFDYI